MLCSLSISDFNKADEDVALVLDDFKFIKHGEFAKEWETHFLDGKSEQEAMFQLNSLLDNPYIKCFTGSAGKVLIPNSEMAQSYAKYVSQAHSWYKHTPISGTNWILLLTPFAPFKSLTDGTEDRIEAMTNKDRFHYNFRTSHDCINRHGSLQYRGDGRFKKVHVTIPSLADDNFERFLEFWKFHANTKEDVSTITMQKDSVELPKILIEIGTVRVNCMIYGTDHLLKLESREKFEHFVLHETGVQLTKEEVAKILQTAEEQHYRNLSGRRSSSGGRHELIKRFVREECEYQKGKIVKAVEMVRELMYGLSGNDAFKKFYREKYEKGHFVAVHAEFLLCKWLEDFAGVRESGWISDYGVEPF